MSDLSEALDQLVDAPTATPAAGSQAEAIIAGALAVIAMMRTAPANLVVDDLRIASNGAVLVVVRPYLYAELFAYRLALRAHLLIAPYGEDQLAKSWSGLFADHPVTITHRFPADAGTLKGATS